MINTKNPPKLFDGNIATLLQQYSQLEDVFGVQQKATTELESLIRVPLCVPKCGLCCEHQTPVISTLEAKYIVSNLTSVTNDVRTAIFTNILDWLTKKTADVTTYSSTVEARTISDEERKILAPQIHKIQFSPCPLLGSNKQCLIHQYRPVNCRAYGVTNAAEPYCRRPRSIRENQNNIAYLQGPTANEVAKKINTLTGLGACGFLPVMILRLARPQELQKLIEEGKVADAKLSLGRIRPWFVFSNDYTKTPKLTI